MGLAALLPLLPLLMRCAGATYLGVPQRFAAQAAAALLAHVVWVPGAAGQGTNRGVSWPWVWALFASLAPACSPPTLCNAQVTPARAYTACTEPRARRPPANGAAPTAPARAARPRWRQPVRRSAVTCSSARRARAPTRVGCCARAATTVPCQGATDRGFRGLT